MFNGRSKEIADPLYSTISVPSGIVPVLDHPLVQRLRWLRQLQTVHWVYPSATHTRFEHSLGAMYLSGVFAEVLLENDLDIDPTYALSVSMLAGLLHDVGHGPYSHTFDDTIWNEYNKNKGTSRNHEKFGHMLIKNTDLGDVIEKNSNVSPEDVVNLLTGKIKPLSYVIVNWIYPGDILDFVNRDRFYTNVDVAPVKRERLIKNTIVDGEKLKLRSKALDTLRTLLISRRDLFTKVYFHKTSLIIDLLIRSILSANYTKYVEALEKAMENDYSDRLGLTDEHILHQALSDPKTRSLALDIFSRKLPYKCVYRSSIGVGIRESVSVAKAGIKGVIKEVLDKFNVPRDKTYIFISHLKTIPDNPYDDNKSIELDVGPKSYEEILPDRSLYRIYVRVYIERDVNVDAIELEKALRKEIEGSSVERQGITM